MAIRRQGAVAVTVISLLLVAIVATPVSAASETAQAGPTAQIVDGPTQQQRAEDILDQPRFGETRPSLWSRFLDWVGDRLPFDGDQATQDGTGQSDGSGESATNPGGPAGRGEGAGDGGIQSGDVTEPPASDGSTGPAPTDGTGSLGLLGRGFQALLAVGALVAVGFGARWLARHRGSRLHRSENSSEAAPAPLDPDALLQRAERAATEGRYSEALRLRFKAGVARLGRRGVIVDGETATNNTIASRLVSAEFDRLSSTFERVVYGGAAATKLDDDEARDTWPLVIERSR